MGEKLQTPRGVTIRENKGGERLQVAFTYKGVRCREVLNIPVTKRNIKYAANLLGEIQNHIERNTFNYAEFFPDSAKLEIFGYQAPTNKTVLEYLQEYQQSAIRRGLSPSTIDGYRKLKNSIKELHKIPVKDLTSGRLKEFVTNSGNSPKTLRNKFSYLRSALAEAVTEGVVIYNPIDSIKLSNYVSYDNKVNLDNEHEDIDPFSKSEVEKILKACRQTEANIIEFVFNTGLRSSEWSAIRWTDVDFENKMVTIKVAIVLGEMKSTKTRAGKREIPLNVAAIDALTRQHQITHPDGFVFPKKSKYSIQLPSGELNRINPDSFRKHRWARILKDASVRYRYPYQMRHTFATRHISEGMNLWQLAKWMGHSSPEMLFRHYGNFIEDYQKVVK